MKNTIARYLIIFIALIFSNPIFAQTPTITVLSNGFNFPDEVLEEHNVAFRANSIDCNLSFTRYYRYYSFKAGFDMALAFDLIAENSDLKFLVWRLPANSDPYSIFVNNSTILPTRTVQGPTFIKGLRDGEGQYCEDGMMSNANGYADGFSGAEQLLRNEVIVIAVYGNNVSDQFDVKINVAEERTIDTFNFKCTDDNYSYDEIFAAVRNDASLTNVEMFLDQNFTQPIATGTIFNQQNQTIYAQVKDDNGNLKYIYKINLWLRIPSDFNEFSSQENTNLRNIQTCETTFIWRGKEWYLNEYLRLDNPSDFDITQIRYVDANGATQIITNPESQQAFPIPQNGNLILHVITKSVNPLKCDNSSEIAFTITNNTVSLANAYQLNKCDGAIITKAELLNLIFPNGSAGYELDVNFTDEFRLDFGTSNEIRIRVRVKYGTNCFTNYSEIVITKALPLNIVDANLTVCLVDLDQNLIDAKLAEIKNGTSANLTYYYQGVSIQYNDILNIIRTNRNGVIEVRVEEGCATSKQLTFNIQESTIRLQNTQLIKEDFCVEPTLVINYTSAQLKAIALSNIISASPLTNYDFKFFDESNSEITSVNNLQTNRRIKVVTKLNTENCTTEFYIELKRINKLVINDAARELTANCDDTIVLTRELLIELFGAEVTTYQINQPLNQPIALNFNTANQAVLTIDFYTNANCVTSKDIIVNKGLELSMNLGMIEQVIANDPFRFCGTINQAELETYLSNYINQIIANNPTTQTEKSVRQYAQEMISNNGRISVVFLDTNQCGTKAIDFTYSQYPSAVIHVEDSFYTCTGQTYRLDLSEYTNLEIYKTDGSRVLGIDNVFALEIGSYQIRLTNEFGCVTTKEIEILNSPTPIIEEIKLNVDSLVIIAHGNGGDLEYSIDGINWQASNQFTGITKGQSYTVYVRENQCAVSSISDVVYLNLPNFISPNGDGINDIWKPIGVNTTLDVRIQIFNRYGNVVYQAEGANALNWNGLHNNKPLSSDSYWYLIEYIDNQAVIKLKYQGYITIKTSK